MDNDKMTMREYVKMLCEKFEWFTLDEEDRILLRKLLNDTRGKHGGMEVAFYEKAKPLIKQVRDKVVRANGNLGMKIPASVLLEMNACRVKLPRIFKSYTFAEVLEYSEEDIFYMIDEPVASALAQSVKDVGLTLLSDREFEVLQKYGIYGVELLQCATLEDLKRIIPDVAFCNRLASKGVLCVSKCDEEDMVD